MPIDALYVLPDTIYLALGLRCWDSHLDARNYTGPGPVIAHPPCGHWGHYSHKCRQPGRDLALIAVDQVRKWGGVLEHPEKSSLFTFCAIPREPGRRDLWGGQTVMVDQGDYGHLARKRSLLYCVGIPGSPSLLTPSGGPSRRMLETLRRRQRAATPLRFALLLLALASQVE